MDLCQQSDISAFFMLFMFYIAFFFPKEQVSFN